jgi:hypothetical protein
MPVRDFFVFTREGRVLFREFAADVHRRGGGAQSNAIVNVLGKAIRRIRNDSVTCAGEPDHLFQSRPMLIFP